MESILAPSPDQSALAVLVIGFVFGLYHAIEADHLAAVSAIVSEHKNVLTASIIGGFWGVGHTISLFVVGALVIFVKVQISESTEGLLEGFVGVMLVLLGVNAIRKIFTAKKIHTHTHEHDGHEHSHIHIHREEKAEAPHHRFAPRSVAVGMIHGLAGSGALMLLVLATIPSPLLGLAYIALFALGALGGMMAMSALIALPALLAAHRFERARGGLRLLAGALSIGVGLFVVYEIGVVEGLLL